MEKHNNIDSFKVNLSLYHLLFSIYILSMQEPANDIAQKKVSILDLIGLSLPEFDYQLYLKILDNKFLFLTYFFCESCNIDSYGLLETEVGVIQYPTRLVFYQSQFAFKHQHDQDSVYIDYLKQILAMFKNFDANKVIVVEYFYKSNEEYIIEFYPIKNFDY